MGLDITAYEIAALTSLSEADYRGLADSEDRFDWSEAERYERAYVVSPLFERSLRGLIEGRYYLVGGKTLRFRAGSYSGYGEWRRALASAALGTSPESVWADGTFSDKPFYELINFSDCEGTIGPEACADLARDFAEHRDRVRPSLSSGPDAEWFAGRYDDWQTAFELAAGTGVVVFH